jgi:hypothetical protein
LQLDSKFVQDGIGLKLTSMIQYIFLSPAVNSCSPPGDRRGHGDGATAMGSGRLFVICHSGAVVGFKFQFFIDSKHLGQINNLTPLFTLHLKKEQNSIIIVTIKEEFII